MLSPLFGVVTGGKHLAKTTFNELGIPVPEPLGSYEVIIIVVIFMTFATVNNVLVGVYNSLMQTEQRPRFVVLIGLLPGFMYAFSTWLIFEYSDWAWTHAGWVILMQTPVISLINCKQIVCNVAKQDLFPIPFSTLWYLLFPLNRLLPEYLGMQQGLTTSKTGHPLLIDEAYVALIVFMITGFWFMHWAFGTIG